MRVAVNVAPGPEWDAFVEAQPAGRLGHAAAWARVVREAYGLAPLYLEARDEQGAIQGILPLVLFRGLLGERELVSMPFLDSGGILARDAAAQRALLDAALEMTRIERAAALELREFAEFAELADAGAAEPGPAHVDIADQTHRDSAHQTRVDLVLALERDADAQWQRLGAKVRNQTRKAESEGLAIAPYDDAERPADHAAGSPARGNARLLADFYAPFASNMRDLGSPVHSERFFAVAADAFGERLRFIVTRLGARPVGGLVAIRFAGAVTVPWASTLRAERARCPNNQIYWEALRWAIASRAREFDFGRSPIGSGTHRFKLGWGAVERPLAWKRFTPNGDRLAPTTAGDNPLLRGLSKLWSRLPVPLTTRLGPALRRRISS